nr:YaaA family protein [Candidatus Soleaferrea massiliensis]
MKLILSPAKNMKRGILESCRTTVPLFPQQTQRLAQLLKGYTAWQLESLMRVNPGIALQAFEDFQRYDNAFSGQPAILSYHGLAYQYLQAESFTRQELERSDAYIRLLSAFYGMLRPLDGIQPYRLEMQCRLRVDGKSLYRFWGDRIYRELFREKEAVVNLASEEYAKMVTPYLSPDDRFITCRFVTRKGDEAPNAPDHGKDGAGTHGALCRSTCAGKARAAAGVRLGRISVHRGIVIPRQLRIPAG